MLIWPAECINWTGALNDRGYGIKYHKGKMCRVPRLTYEMHYGPIPDGMVVRHTCDNRACYNPAHLELGTQKDNVQDCVDRGRRADLKGSDFAHAKLNEEKVREIKRALKEPVRGIGNALAKKYGVHHSIISDIKHGRQWKHVTV